MKIFISYEHNSWPLAKILNENLTGKGHTVYWDFHLHPGVPFNEKISSFIADCEHFLLVLSPAALTSMWVNAEIGYAKALQKNIIPIKLEGVTIGEIENLAFLGKTQVLDWPTLKDITEDITSAMDKSNYKDMIGISPIKLKGGKWVCVRLVNNSEIDLYDIQTSACAFTMNEKGLFAVSQMPARKHTLILQKEGWIELNFRSEEVLPVGFKFPEAFKKGNRLSVLCKFSFQNQERAFSTYRSLELIEFVLDEPSLSV